MKKYFKFADGSIAYLKEERWFGSRPVEVYTSQILGLGEWKEY